MAESTTTTATTVPAAPEGGEVYQFQAEINELMTLIINTFYTNKDIFLRELISNASDALEKIRHESLTEPSALSAEEELFIHVIPNKAEGTLTIHDSGIGMTKADLINNLGTIAHSGTKRFVDQLAQGSGADVSVIGQFGVGFYAGYLVANHVTVISKNNDDDCYQWDSSAGGTFTVTPATDPTLKRGTKVILHLKDDQKQYLEQRTIEDVIKKHSEFIGFPISLQVEKTKTVDVTDDDEEAEAKEGEEKEKKTKKVTEVTYEWALQNANKPLWMRDRTEVTAEEYQKFYKAISNDWDPYLAVKHFNFEGSMEFRALLFCPRRAPMDMFETSRKKNNIRLYVSRVFLMDDCERLIPEWLSFIKGIVDSEDLPLNISRQHLQHDRVLTSIRKHLVRKCIEMFEELSENKAEYNVFYEQFSKNLKLGIHDHESSAHRKQLSDLLRYYSTTSGDELVSLRDYVTNMKENQKVIYYVAGESRAALENSPFVEQAKSRGLEVLFMTDPMDEYAMQQLRDYDDKKFVCLSKEGVKFEETEDEKASREEEKEAYAATCTFIKATLGDKVEKVVLSDRLTKSPCVLVTGEFGWSANMERIMRAQALRDASTSSYMISKKTLEINPKHPIVVSLKDLVSKNKEDKTSRDLVILLFETALLTSQFSLDDPNAFATRIHRMIKLALSSDDAEEEGAPAEEETAAPAAAVSAMEDVD